MKTALAVIAVLVLQVLSASPARPQAVNRVLIAELQFAHDSSGTPTLELKKQTVYWAEVVGRGTPLLKAVRSGGEAFFVPSEGTNEPRSFRIYPAESAIYAVTIVGGDSSATATLRVYRDVAETERIRGKEDRGGIVGFLFAVGAHTGLGLDSVAGPHPSGGSNYEACLLMQSSDRFATCLGGARQYMPGEDYVAGWLFIEERARLFTAQPLGHHNTDFGVALRLSKSMGVDARSVYPGMLSFGFHVTQHLSGGGRRRGMSLVASWLRASLKGTHTSKDPVADQFVAGLIWVP